MSNPGPGQVLFEFVRHWSRRSFSNEHVAEQGRLVLVVEAVHSLTRRGIASTVNAVAYEIGIDQSGASRSITIATEAGYLVLEPFPSDGRQRQATLTDSGHALLEDAHDWQEQVFNRLTEGWDPQQRIDFQKAMTDLIDRSYTLRA